jgi:hypothetical protein
VCAIKYPVTVALVALFDDPNRGRFLPSRSMAAKARTASDLLQASGSI